MREICTSGSVGALGRQLPRATRRSAEGREPPEDEPKPASAWPSRAAGMVAVAESYLAGSSASGNGGERFQVSIHVDQDPLAADGTLAATLDDGSRVAAEALRRVACDCGIVAMTGEGEHLNVGRRTRSIPPAIRRVLRERDLPLPWLHARALPARPSLASLAARRRDQRGQPGVAVHISSPPGARRRLPDRA